MLLYILFFHFFLAPSSKCSAYLPWHNHHLASISLSPPPPPLLLLLQKLNRMGCLYNVFPIRWPPYCHLMRPTQDVCSVVMCFGIIISILLSELQNLARISLHFIPRSFGDHGPGSRPARFIWYTNLEKGSEQKVRHCHPGTPVQSRGWVFLLFFFYIYQGALEYGESRLPCTRKRIPQ